MNSSKKKTLEQLKAWNDKVGQLHTHKAVLDNALNLILDIMINFKEIIRIHGLTLLNFYGVDEKIVENAPEALNVFVKELTEEFRKIFNTIPLDTENHGECNVNCLLARIKKWREDIFV